MQASAIGTTSPSGSDSTPRLKPIAAAATCHETDAKRDSVAMQANQAARSSAHQHTTARPNGSAAIGRSAASAYPGSGAGIVTPGLTSKKRVRPSPTSHDRNGSV